MKRASMSSVALLLSLCSVSRAEEWKIADGPLMTRWAKDVSPESVWPEYPRPLMVRDEWVNLNGLWDYAIRPRSEESRPERWDGQILVPFPAESALSGVMKPVRPDQQLWYQRTFAAPPRAAGTRLLLHFGAVDWKCTVWLNGKRVGEHTGGYDPFTFDITEVVKIGENKVSLVVWDPTNRGYQPRGKQVLRPGGIMYTAVTGIWQTVWLETVPAASIRALKTVPNIDRGTVAVAASIVGQGKDLSVEVTASDGGQTVATASGQPGQTVELKIENAKLWSPDSPHLYDLEVKLLRGGKAIDTVDSYFGMRKIEVSQDEEGIQRLKLNGEVLFQYGPLDQGWWPDGLYLPASDAAFKYDVAVTKKLGMNMARKHVKYEPARWYYWCDKLGLLVWQDMPAGDSGRSDESKANFRRELKAMIDTLHNFPCIVMWVPFNEGWGQHDTGEIATWIEEYDPTRPVNEASGWHDRGSGQVSDMHSYPGPGMRPVEEKRASVLGEFGGLGMPVKGHLWQEDRNWGYVTYQDSEALTDAYVGLLTKMRPLIGKGLSAAVYTQTSDVEIEVNGLMTYDREIIKMDAERIAAAARKLYLPPPIVRTLVATSEKEPQTWRYTTQEPAKEWYTPDFDDSSWKSSEAGFGTEGTPGSVVRTKWESPDIWLRRSFTLDAIPGEGEIGLSVHHDEDAEIYINGQLVRKLQGFVTGYSAMALDEKAVKALRAGKNSIAVHCHQTRGGQYIDVGLVLIIEREK